MKTRKLILCALFTALIIIGAFLKIPTGIIPFTMQVFFVILSGLMLEPKFSMVPTAVYVVIGLIGLPVFSKGGGLGYVYEPTFGFILGFIFFAFLVSVLVRKNLIILISKNIKISKSIIAIKVLVFSLFSLISLYIVGVAYMYLLYTFYLGKQVEILGLIISSTGFYFIFDIVKFTIAIPICAAVMKRIPDILLSRKQ